MGDSASAEHDAVCAETALDCNCSPQALGRHGPQHLAQLKFVCGGSPPKKEKFALASLATTAFPWRHMSRHRQHYGRRRGVKTAGCSDGCVASERRNMFFTFITVFFPLTSLFSREAGGQRRHSLAEHGFQPSETPSLCVLGPERERQQRVGDFISDREMLETGFSIQK